MLKRSMNSAIIGILFLLFSLVLQIIEKKKTLALFLGIIALFSIIFGLSLDYRDLFFTVKEFRLGRAEEYEVNAVGPYLSGIILLSISLFDFRFILNLHNLFDMIIFITWILSIIALIGAIIFWKLQTSLGKSPRKRKKDTCPKCGVKVQPGYNICSHCGERISYEEEN